MAWEWCEPDGGRCKTSPSPSCTAPPTTSLRSCSASRKALSPCSPRLLDKLAPTKAAERERKEAHKAELAATKAAKHEATSAKSALFREERAASHEATKRAAADERKAARKDKHAAGARVCEHGVSRCRICFPPENGRKK